MIDDSEIEEETGPLPPHRLLGLTDDEYELIQAVLGREPRPAELGMYSVMWSEHCSYKSSRAHLGRLPTTASHVVVGPGENAGVIDLGQGVLAALRIESHNHPSFVEPYQGAATGVGGILRDVFTMGARPVALWDSLRLGPLGEARNRYLFKGVVAGIAGYGNAVGVPTVGGEVAFAEHYSDNPLVNVMCLGLLSPEQLVLSTSGPEGTLAVLLGAATGRDGIGGASVLASSSFDEESAQKRPSVQVGDPFEEKKLIEACLELYERHLVVGVQDLGAGGLSCAISEPVAKAGMGISIELDRVHVREPGMSSAELLTSESQERMLAYVDPARIDEVMEVTGRWEIKASVIGAVEPGGVVRVYHGGDLVAEVPAASLTGQSPVYRRPSGEPGWMEDLWANTVKFVAQPAIATAVIQMLGEAEMADKSWVFEQYDHMLFLNTVVGPGNDGTLLRLPGEERAVALAVDGDGRLCYLDPRRGAARLVYEAALNVAVTGARPLAVVDNLNFGNPEKPEIMWQFQEAVGGIAEACESLGIPVIGGNVSFYNETSGLDIYPTPVVGVIGLADPMPSPPPRLDRGEEGMDLWLFGPEWAVNLAGSAFEKVTFGHVGGRPSGPDPTMAKAANIAAASLAQAGIPVLHDISAGGLAITVAEICLAAGVGAVVHYTDWRHLFCEDPHRFVVAAHPDRAEIIAAIAAEIGIPSAPIGNLGGREMVFDRSGLRAAIDLDAAINAWKAGLIRFL
jgi:phosphoribosylformylglycinamidine synthase